jgi:tetratricopeptide (TPR) repeat protein
MSHFINTPISVKKVLLVLLLAGTVSFSVGGISSGGYDAPYFQADFSQDLTEWTSLLVNPALLYRVNQIHLSPISFYRWDLFDKERLGYQHFSAIFPIRRNHSLGITLLTGGKAIQRTTINDYNTINEDLGRTRYNDYWFIGSYSIRTLPWLMLGTNIKYRMTRQFDQWAFGSFPGFDLGVYLNPIDHYRLGDLGFSVTFQDIVPSQIPWKDTTGSINSKEITNNRFRAGIRYSLFNDNLVGDIEYVADNLLGSLYEAFKWDDYVKMYKDQKVDSLSNSLGKIPIAHRMGVHLKYMFIPNIWLKGGWTNNNIPYLGFNYNLIFTLPESINYLNFDCHFGYSFIEALLKESDRKDERGFSVVGKMSVDFGPTREQRESERLYDKLILAPMDAYNEAMRLYLAGKYWEASFAFGKVISLFPNFHLNDKATWYMGNCYRFLYMNDAARKVYKDALEEYSTSEMRSKYLYGIQNIDYRENKYDDALKNHAFITNLYSESDIRPDADYLAGQIHFLRKNYNVAEQLLGSLKPGDPSYLYAQYTLSIINIDNNKEQAAIQNLTNIIRDTTQEASDQLLQDASNLKLGHLYFEMGDQLRLAVEAYQRVSNGSTYEDEALLGTSWAWIKVNQPNVALQTIEKLIGNYSETSLIPEAFLVKGYSLMLLRKYAEAVAALDQSIATAKRSFLTDEDLKKKTSEFEQTVTQFTPTEEKIVKNALRKPTNKTMEERPQLQKEFETFAKENKEYFKYTLLAKSHTRFFKRKEQIVTDAEYALAKATSALNRTKAATEDRNESKIDKELEKLKNELNNSSE